VLRSFASTLRGKPVALIGAGGVENGATALAKIKAGASAVQIYTALIYAGPGLVRRIARDLAMRLRAEGFRSIADAVGVDRE
jgi:dihydroorotate dehydrogenase